MADMDPRVTRAREWEADKVWRCDAYSTPNCTPSDPYHWRRTADQGGPMGCGWRYSMGAVGIALDLLAWVEEQPTIEIHHELGKPTTCKIMRGGRVIFWGTSLEHRFPELRGPDHG